MRRLCFIIVMLLAAWPAGRGEEQKIPPLTVEWLGHACFLVTSPGGTRMLFDPYTPSAMVKYPTEKIDADVVLMSHFHADHNNRGMARGNPKVFEGLTQSGDWNKISETVGDVKISTVATYHYDPASGEGQERGKNSAFVVQMGEVSLVHLGDLGHKLSAEQVKQIGRVDILLVPVGGVYTIDGRGAHEVIAQLHPRVIIPMHYKTEHTALPLAGVDKFLEGQENVVRQGASSITIDKLPEKPQIIILEWKR